MLWKSLFFPGIRDVRGLMAGTSIPPRGSAKCATDFQSRADGGTPRFKSAGEEDWPEARGEGGMMADAINCRRSKFVHVNCDRCGGRPEVVHRPRNERGTYYCQACCPVCKQQQPAAGGASPREDNPGAAIDSVRRSGRE